MQTISTERKPRFLKAPGIQDVRRLEETLGEGRGLTPRLVQAVFARIRQENLDVTVTCSYLQVIHETVIDLLPEEGTGNSSSGGKNSIFQ